MNNQNINQSINPSMNNNYMDIMMSNLLFSKLGDVLKENFDLTPKNIIKIIILLSSGEIKNLIKNFINYIFEFIKLSPNYIKILYINLLNMKLKKINIKQIESKYELKIKIESDESFLIGLYNYIKNNNLKHKKSIKGIEINNTKEQIRKEIIYDIYFSIENIDIFIGNEINYKINIETDEIIEINKNNENNKIFLDFLSIDERNEINKIVKHLENNLSNDIMDKILDEKFYMNECKVFCEYTIAIEISKKYNILLKEILLTIICCCHQIKKNIHMNLILNIYNNRNKFIFDTNNKYNINKSINYPDYINSHVNGKIDYILNLYPTEYEIYTKINNSFSNQYAKMLHEKNINEKNISEKNNSSELEIIINSNSYIEEEYITKKLINTIYSSYKRKTKSIKINIISIEEEKKINKIENPEYKEWLMKKEIMEKIDINMTSKIPVKEIEQEIINKKISIKQLNECEKNIETLYLKEKDMKKLLSSLTLFRDKKKILKDMGFPNKLNILLHGPPGTGKSTTIQAVATYLQKDIYYMDLNRIKKNEEIQQMIEYVNKSVNNGGIIVIEDIDAMTDIVKSRDIEVDEKTIDTLEEGITLEYLLNILQGTLTMEDSIFIITTNYIEKLDKALYRAGRFDVNLKLELCDHYQIKNIYKKLLGKEISIQVLNLIDEYKYSPAEIIYHLKNYIFEEKSDKEIFQELFKN
jgi:ATP-dependent 26S proteasome regulatory subunit